MMLPPPVAGNLLGRSPCHDLVQHRLLLSMLSQQPAQALDVFANAARTGEDDADIGGRYIDTLVEHLAGDQDRIFTRMKTKEDLPAFLRLGLVRDRRDEKTAGDLIDGGVIVGEYQHSVAAALL